MFIYACITFKLQCLVIKFIASFEYREYAVFHFIAADKIEDDADGDVPPLDSLPLLHAVTSCRCICSSCHPFLYQQVVLLPFAKLICLEFDQRVCKIQVHYSALYSLL